jgi:hypothetical protein
MQGGRGGAGNVGAVLTGLVLGAVVVAAGLGFVVGRATADTDDGGAERIAATSTTTMPPTTTTTEVEPADEGLYVPEDDPDVPPATVPPATEGQLTHTLTVHDDGCGVVRTEADPEPDGLTWSVYDEDGFSVLGRNALGETRYRYFTPGTYTMVLEAWGGDSYVPVSNEVTITC